MITVSEVYRTSDGTVFDELGKAEAHETMQFKDWISRPQSATFKNFLSTLNSDKEDEYYGTEHDMAKHVLTELYAHWCDNRAGEEDRGR